MDPYRILDVPKDCTREEANVAFRAWLLSAHSDAGGDVTAVIRVHTAYKQILLELDRRSRPMRKSIGRQNPQTPPWPQVMRCIGTSRVRSVSRP